MRAKQSAKYLVSRIVSETLKTFEDITIFWRTNGLSMPDNRYLLIIPLGLLVIWLLDKDDKPETMNVGPHILEESDQYWIVKTQNATAPLADIIKLPHVIVECGETNGHIVFKTFQYDKTRYSKEDVCKIVKEQLSECPRCTVK